MDSMIRAATDQILKFNNIADSQVSSHPHITFQEEAVVTGMIVSYEQMFNINFDGRERQSQIKLSFDNIALMDVKNEVIVGICYIECVDRYLPGDNVGFFGIPQ